MSLSAKALDLIERARGAILLNYDSVEHMHTVGAALRTKSGQVFVGVNVHSIHGACAEQIALGAAITAGEREFAAIVAVAGENGEDVLSPCGNCRQMLMHYIADGEVILQGEDGLCKVKVVDLLPFAYQVN